MIEFGATSSPRNGSPSLCPAAKGPRRAMNLGKITRHTMPSNFPANSLKTNDGYPSKVTHKMSCKFSPRHRPGAHVFSPVGAWHTRRADLWRAMPGNRPWLDRATRALAIFLFLFSIFCFPSAAQPQNAPAKIPGDLASDLKDFVETPSVSGYENQLSEQIRAKVAAFHPVVDNLGDVIVTIGSGAPHRLILTPIDEPGFVVSGITDDGYLRLQRLPQSGLPPIFNALYSAQPVKIRTTSGKWIDGVVAGISVHLHRTGETTPSASDIENMYVDIGASSAAEARAAGVDVLSPVAINRGAANLADGKVAGASIGDKFGAAILVDLLRSIDPQAVKGTLTVAFLVQERVGGRGLERMLRTTRADEMIYVGRLVPGGKVPGMEGVHRAPRREPGSGVLIGLDKSSGELSGIAADLKQLADANKIPFATDYSADITPAGYLPPPAFPARWAHVGIATAWPDTPAETIHGSDSRALIAILRDYLSLSSPTPAPQALAGYPDSLLTLAPKGRPQNVEILRNLVETYGVSNHENNVLDQVKYSLPPWAKVERGDNKDLIVYVGSPSADAKVPRIMIIAHTDEIGFEVKSISSDGRLEVETLGGMELSFYEGHPMLVHTSTGDHDGIMELPNGWDEANFKWPAESDQTIRVDVGARSADDVADLGIKVGDSITIPKKYRPLLGTRANGRSFDDRVGDTALISAVWALGGPLKDRDVTFVWSTGEEIGLVGAGALAKRLAAEGHSPDYVFTVDTLVSSDSPLESKRFADAEIGKGFAIRAVDNSNIAPRDLVAKVEKLARANQIPYQLGVTGGGNDGATFVPYGAVDIALGWPLRYSHSPAEVIDTRDVDALARIIAVIARSW
jgi:putative aminopeptidase FrvX